MRPAAQTARAQVTSAANVGGGGTAHVFDVSRTAPVSTQPVELSPGAGSVAVPAGHEYTVVVVFACSFSRVTTPVCPTGQAPLLVGTHCVAVELLGAGHAVQEPPVVVFGPMLNVPSQLVELEDVGPGHVHVVVIVPFSVRDRDQVCEPNWPAAQSASVPVRLDAARVVADDVGAGAEHVVVQVFDTTRVLPVSVHAESDAAGSDVVPAGHEYDVVCDCSFSRVITPLCPTGQVPLVVDTHRVAVVLAGHAVQVLEVVVHADHATGPVVVGHDAVCVCVIEPY